MVHISMGDLLRARAKFLPELAGGRLVVRHPCTLGIQASGHFRHPGIQASAHLCIHPAAQVEPALDGAARAEASCMRASSSPTTSRRRF